MIVFSYYRAMVKYLAWKRTKMAKQNKITNFWILQMQFCVEVVSVAIYVLMAVHFNPEWNWQLLITAIHSQGFLFILLYFHKFNGWFKYGSFFYLDFISNVLTVQGNIYVLERCRCSLSHDQTLRGYMAYLVHLLMFNFFNRK